MNVPIKITKGFIKKSEISSLVDYIDRLESNELDKFASYKEGKRLALQFGEEHEPKSYMTLDLIKEKQDLIKQYFERVIDLTTNKFELLEVLYLCSFWIAKQYPGGDIEAHEDTDDGYSPHMDYSAVLYLSTAKSGGELHFIDLDYFYKPEAGDLIIFPSKGTGYHEVLNIKETRYSIPFWMSFDSAKSLV